MAVAYTAVLPFHLNCVRTKRLLHDKSSSPRPCEEITKGRPIISRLQGCSSTASICFPMGLQAAPSTSSALAQSHNVSTVVPALETAIPERSYATSSYLQRLVLVDLDPATAKLAIGIMGPFLSAFGFLFIIRIVMSWYPKLPVGKFPYVIAYAPTEPLLNVTRKLIPPVGGVDVTPVVWFGLISFLNEILVGPQGLLVLLSQQV